MVALDPPSLAGYWSQVVALVERELPEFTVEPGGTQGFENERLTLGHGVIGRWPGLDPGAAQHLPRVARIAGQGFVIGLELCHQCDVGELEARAIADVCALANVMISGFDHVVDGPPVGAAELTSAMSRDRIVEALDLHREGRYPVFSRSPFGDPAAAYVAAVGEAFFAQCRRLGTRKADDRKWARLASTVLEAYDAELIAANPGDRPIECLREAFRLKSAHSCSILGGVVDLSSATGLTRAEGCLIEAMEPLGEVAGMVDDLCDLGLDVRGGQLSSLLLLIDDEKFLRNDSGRDLAGAFEALARDKVLERAIGTMAASIRALSRNSREILRDPDRFMQHVRLWLGTWLSAGPIEA